MFNALILCQGFCTIIIALHLLWLPISAGRDLLIRMPRILLCQQTWPMVKWVWGQEWWQWKESMRIPIRYWNHLLRGMKHQQQATMKLLILANDQHMPHWNIAMYAECECVSVCQWLASYGPVFTLTDNLCACSKLSFDSYLQHTIYIMHDDY